MKTDKNILIAFILNFGFAVFELIGGAITGSVAIMSDAIHDIGDAASIGFSYFLERKSRRQPDRTHTYGYMRYSVLGGLVTTCILLVGSVAVIYNAIERLFNPVEINYEGMLFFAVVGVIVNFCAAYFTRDGDSINQKSVNLHMLEDVLGWTVVLVGGVIMYFTDISVIDPLMSIGVAIFILVNAIRNLKEVENLFLEKTPEGIDIDEIRHHLCKIDGVSDVHHIHVWSMDGISNYATMHIVAEGDSVSIKDAVRKELREHHIGHSTLELESPDEDCQNHDCHTHTHHSGGHHHHHHGHHHHHHHSEHHHSEQHHH